ncbi:uncharacterized protein CTRU02_215546 [Colletotrichum truncatum]|uniref:Uncharacterized protein n=2 Tax=Colletotrichum truncatum TaxID=5467 RepID=A0ACC3YC41_COLTU|nr:uncharacterized protein CTRU02_05517 [Colletotrichum truncatum]KAF6793960.1 hypothetical protein CTRU02_05517 [Colletotrichum truncatum]
MQRASADAKGENPYHVPCATHSPNLGSRIVSTSQEQLQQFQSLKALLLSKGPQDDLDDVLEQSKELLRTTEILHNDMSILHSRRIENIKTMQLNRMATNISSSDTAIFNKAKSRHED